MLRQHTPISMQNYKKSGGKERGMLFSRPTGVGEAGNWLNLPKLNKLLRDMMKYRKAGRAECFSPRSRSDYGIISGSVDDQRVARDMIVTAFDNGVCHFDG